jgi:hypothetical protein
MREMGGLRLAFFDVGKRNFRGSIDGCCKCSSSKGADGI